MSSQVVAQVVMRAAQAVNSTQKWAPNPLDTNWTVYSVVVLVMVRAAGAVGQRVGNIGKRLWKEEKMEKDGGGVYGDSCIQKQI